AVRSNPIALRRISSTSRIAASSSTTRTFCFTPPSLPLLELQVDLLEPLEVGAELVGLLADPRQVALTLGKLVAHARELLVEPRDLVAGRHDRGHRVAARPDRLGVVGVLRQVRVVHRAGRAVVAVGGEPIGLCEQRRRTPEGTAQAPRAAAGEDQRQRDRHPRARHERGRSTVNRLPFPSCDSTVTRPPWACATPRTIARPRPVPPRSPCACRYGSNTCGSSARGMPMPVASARISSPRPVGTHRPPTPPPPLLNPRAVPCTV